MATRPLTKQHIFRWYKKISPGFISLNSVFLSSRHAWLICLPIMWQKVYLRAWIYIAECLNLLQISRGSKPPAASQITRLCVYHTGLLSHTGLSSNSTSLRGPWAAHLIEKSPPVRDLVPFTPWHGPPSELTLFVHFFASLLLGCKLPGYRDQDCLVWHHGPRLAQMVLRIN